MPYLLIVLLIGLFSAGFYASVKILKLLTAFLSTSYKISIVALSPADAMTSVLWMDVLMVGLVLLPFIISALVIYIKPALYEKERRYLNYIPLIYLNSLVGLAIGWVMATWLFIPYFESFSQIVGVQNVWAVNNIVSFIMFNFVCGVVICQIPLIVVILVNQGIIKLNQLAKLRKTVFVISVVLAAVITPTPDAVTQIVVSLPLYLLFEASIQYCRLKQKFKRR